MKVKNSTIKVSTVLTYLEFEPISFCVVTCSPLYTLHIYKASLNMHKKYITYNIMTTAETFFNYIHATILPPPLEDLKLY